MDQSTIRAFQKVLTNHVFKKPVSFSEDFAQRRFLKKFQEPDLSRSEQLTNDCWQGWLDRDRSLPKLGLLPGNWYKARSLLHERLGHVQLDDISFPQGSEFIPTRGRNSVEARLALSRWTTTIDNFEQFARVCYSHTGLKRAVRRRFARWYQKGDFDIPQCAAEKLMYRKYKSLGYTNGIGFHIFSWKLRQVVSFTQGSRFSTVPKNNEKRRPINVEPFGNIIVQRAIGNWIRGEIKAIFGVDLLTCQQVHRKLISDVSRWATIDLKDASDSILLKLCRFLLPDRVYRFIESSRSQMIYGLDGDYHLVNKVSSMGNGFTFELMTLILLAVSRQLDSSASVFGDDIIIAPERAEELIGLLNRVGFVVNVDKTFITGPFRESCGANYHQDEGYVESYDFLWPESIGDCCMIWNKVVRLSLIYPSFSLLKQALGRALPHALHGGPDLTFTQRDHLDLVGWRFGGTDEPEATTFPQYFVTKSCVSHSKLSKEQAQALLDLCLNPLDFSLVKGYEFKSKLRSDTLSNLHPRRHWAKYLMYLASGRRAKDVITGEGTWRTVWFVKSEYRSFRAGSLFT